MADYKEDKKREEPRPISDAESEKALIEKLEREYFYKKSNGFEVESSKDQEEAREEVEKIIDSVSGDVSSYELIKLAEVVKKDPLNPKTFKNLQATGEIQSRFSRAVPASATTGKRYISAQAFNVRATAPTASQLGGIETIIPDATNETGLVIRVTRKPFGGIGYDEAIHLDDVTVYNSNVANFGAWSSPPTSSQNVVQSSDSDNLYLVYRYTAFLPASGGFYNYVLNNGMLPFYKLKVKFQSGHEEVFDMKVPVGSRYSHGPNSLEWAVNNYGALNNSQNIQRINDCSTSPLSQSVSPFYTQGRNLFCSGFALQNSYGILTQWEPVVNPSGLNESVSLYSAHTSPMLFNPAVGAFETRYVFGNDNDSMDITWVAASTNGKTHVDSNTTAKQEIHKIDTVLQNNTGYTPLIANQNENWYKTNFTSHSSSPDTWEYIGSSLSSLSNTVGIIQSQNQNQLFTYTVFYSENITPCQSSPTYAYNVCNSKGNPSHYETTGLDCLGNTIPTTHLPGGSVFQTGVVNFTHFPSCCTTCTLNFSVLAYPATFGGTDGYIEWSALISTLNPATGSGNDFSSNSAYTFTVTAANGSTLTGTLPPTGGNSVTVATTVNDTSGTANRFTVSSNAQITPGMKIVSGHTFYSAASGGVATTAYVGDVYAGNLNNNATEFYLVDINGNSVYSQSDATPSLVFAIAFTGQFGALAPNDIANSYYEACLTDEDGCEECVIFTIREGLPPSGCTDNTAVNYSSTAVIDDGSCVLCDSTSGLLVDPINGNSTQLFDNFQTTHIPATWNSGYGAATTHNSDGQLIVSADVIASVQSYLDWDANSNFTIKVYKVLNAGDISTSAGATLVQTINAGTLNNVSNAAATVTGLAYGFYSVKFTYVDSNSASTMENCFSEFTTGVSAQVCDDNVNPNYMSVPSNAFLRTAYSPLCGALPCCTISGPNIVPFTTLGSSCEPYFEITIDCSQVGRIISAFILEFSQNNSNWTTIASTNSVTINVQPGLPQTWDVIPFGTQTSYLLAYGTGYYRISATASELSTGDVCTIQNTEYYKKPTSGCTDPNALNYNATVVCEDGTCIYESFDCVSGNCVDPGTGNGQYATLAACQNNCFAPPVLGCTDSCATNYNPIAMVDDGSCIYRACLDQTASNYWWSCDCNTQKLTATINDQACCVTPCSLSETIVAHTQNATATCVSFNNDGEVYIQFSNNNNATNWTFKIYDAIGTTLIYTDPNVYSGTATVSNTYLGLGVGTYTAEVTTSLGSPPYNACTFTLPFYIESDSVVLGCTDPTASNYNPAALCDDGSCFVCGCPDPNAINYNPSATSVCQCEYDVEVVSPCLPVNVDTIVTKTQACLTLKGSEWLFDYKLGRATDCPIMDKWKLILIEYLLTQKEDGIDCLYNCVDSSQIAINNTTSCTDLWVQGGPSTGVNHDSNHLGASVSAGEGTTITTYDGYPLGWFGYDASNTPQTSNKSFVGDVVKFNLPTFHPLASNLNGTIWELTTVSSNPTGLHEGCALQKVGHYTKCVDYKKIDIVDSINYYQKFVNFVNKFCRDCNISILNKTKQ